MARKKKLVAVFDFETDPFKYGRVPEPFCVGFYTEQPNRIYWEHWCDSPEKVVEAFLNFIDTLDDDYIIYAHNGGKFDFFYLLKAGAICNPIKLINGRIVKAAIGRHELRDSYAILPIPLAAYQKDEIDYRLFERDTRDEHRADILHYLATDCQYLYSLVTSFIDKFGVRLTIGGTAINALKEFHPFDNQGETHDGKYRPFYYGGRVQAYETGVINGQFKIYDVNSMYPSVMRDKEHPTGSGYTVFYDDDDFPLDGNGFLVGEPLKPYFIIVDGFNRGALPVRTKAGLDFNVPYGRFYTTSHELQVALKHCLFDIERIIELRAPNDTIKFRAFVDEYIVGKIEAKRAGNKADELFYKLILNSSYGKFGQDSRNYADYYIRYKDEELPDEEWSIKSITPDFEIWDKPSDRMAFFDVATAASITGASRAVLLDAIATAKRPIYCDTDSIICEDLSEVELDKLKLGAWDMEAEGDMIAIAGKKLYALFNNGEYVKMACKGANLEPADIVKIANGATVEWANDAPSFAIFGPTRFVRRKIKRT